MPQYFPLLPFSFLGVTKCPSHYCTSCSALLICCSRSLPLAFASCSNARARASTCWLMIQTTGHHEQPQGLVSGSLILHLLKEVLHNTLSLLPIPAVNVAHKAWIMPRWHLKHPKAMFTWSDLEKTHMALLQLWPSHHFIRAMFNKPLALHDPIWCHVKLQPTTC